MGPRLMRRPPKYVHGFVDHDGKARFYFRRAGFKTVALPGLPWSPEFMSAYDEAKTAQGIAIGAERTKQGTLRALAVAYYNSKRFADMEASTQGVYRNIVDRLCEQRDRDGNKLADKRIATLRREHIVKLLDERDKPESANGLRKVLRAMMQHAVEIRPAISSRVAARATAITHGPRRRSRNSSAGMRSAASHGWRWRCCSIPASVAATLSAWVASTSATMPFTSSSRRPAWFSIFPFTTSWRRSLSTHRTAT
jgi:hypothetical protein